MREQARERVISMMREGQARLIATFEALDAVGRFVGSSWEQFSRRLGSIRARCMVIARRQRCGRHIPVRRVSLFLRRG